MREVAERPKLFYADSTPVEPKNYIFDNVYRNANEK
jgi:hypothetical protein